MWHLCFNRCSFSSVYRIGWADVEMQTPIASEWNRPRWLYSANEVSALKGLNIEKETQIKENHMERGWSEECAGDRWRRKNIAI